MKKLLFLMRVVASVFVAVFALSYTGIEIPFITDLVLSNTEGVIIANLVPAALADPQIMKQWSQMYFYRVQKKSAFDESMTGTKIAKDGPKPSDLVAGSPILLVNSIKDRSGNVVTHTLIEPMFESSYSRLNYARVKQQVREGTEKSLNRKFVKTPIATAFWGIKEEDVFMGKQETGVSDYAKLMTRGLSDNTSAYMDDDTLFSFFGGYSKHLFATAGEVNGVANGDSIDAEPNLGLVSTISEHPNSFYWTDNKLVAPSANNAEQHATRLNAMESDDTAGEKLMNAIALKVKTMQLQPIVYKGVAGRNRGYIRVLVDPIIMQQIRNDSLYKDTVNSAYQAKGDEHPLIAQGDILWGPLHITEENKLLDEQFGCKYNYHADGYNDGTNDWSTAGEYQVVGSAGEVSREVHVKLGERFYYGTDNGPDSISGGATGDLFGNVVVMGANSLSRVPGPVRKLIPRTTDDYRRIIGLGSEHIFGHKRLDFTDDSSVFAFNQSSFRVVVYRGVQ
jgi:hypothetical protein